MGFLGPFLTGAGTLLAEAAPALTAVGTAGSLGLGIYSTATAKNPKLPSPPNLAGKKSTQAEYAELLRQRRAASGNVFAGAEGDLDFTQPTLLGPGGGL